MSTAAIYGDAEKYIIVKNQVFIVIEQRHYVRRSFIGDLAICFGVLQIFKTYLSTYYVH